jgi:asparagine synthase (glutamine-hydrolysing)
MEDFARRSQVVERTRPPASKRQYPTYAQQGIADFALSGWHAHCLEENDREAAAHGIEERHPFYDRQLVEFLFAVPDDLRCRGTQVKYILRQAMSGALPGRLLSRLHQAEFSGLLWSAMDTVNVEGMFAHSRLRDLNWVDAGVLQDDYRNRHNQGGRGPWVFWFFAGMEYWASGVLPGPSTDPAREPEPQTAC